MAAGALSLEEHLGQQPGTRLIECLSFAVNFLTLIVAIVYREKSWAIAGFPRYYDCRPPAWCGRL